MGLYGFIQIPDAPRRLFLPMTAIEKIFAQNLPLAKPSSLPLPEFAPAFVQSGDGVLKLFDAQTGAAKQRRSAGDCGTVQRVELRREFGFGFGNPLLDSLKLAHFRETQLLFRGRLFSRRQRTGKSPSDVWLRTSAAFLLRALPRVPLRVASKALEVAQPIEAQHDR